MKKIINAGIVTLALAITGPAHAAGYNISAQSSATAGGIYDNGAKTCAYNFGGTGGNCFGGNPNPASNSGTVTPTGGDGTAKYVSMATSASGANVSANSSVSVDLSNGSIGLYGADNAVIGCNCTALGGGYTNNYARYSDTLHFTVAGADAQTITPISLIFTLAGTMYNQGTAMTYAENAAGEIFGQLNFGHSDARFDLKSNNSTNYLTQVNYLDTYPSGAPGVWTTNADHTVNTYTENYLLTGSIIDLGVALEANLQCGTGYFCDFSHTAKLGLTLPTGVSFTSDSGTFLTAGAPTAGAVPEPATWAMMVFGFGLAGGTMRRRNTVRSGAMA
jgi:hypothetical protein